MELNHLRSIGLAVWPTISAELCHIGAAARQAAPVHTAPACTAPARKAAEGGPVAQPGARPEALAKKTSDAPTPMYRLLPTVPAFTRSATAPNGYRVTIVNPAFCRGNVFEVGTDPKLVSSGSLPAAGASVTSKPAVVAKTAGKETKPAVKEQSGVPGTEGPQNPEAWKSSGLYSKFDDKGVPTHDASGEALTKNAQKKLIKLWDTEKKKAEKTKK